MSKFKTQKLSLPKKWEIHSWNLTTTPQKLDKWTSKSKRWIIGTLIFIASILFIWNFVLRALGNISVWSLWWEPSVFTPTIAVWTGIVEKVQWSKNILIAGIGWQWHDWSLLTDSIMLASINNDDGYVTLLSIPRDLFVAYPKQYWIAGKINALYSIGVANKVGIKPLAEKISEVTGQPIDGYIVIDFTWFKSIIDALWWVHIDVPKDLVDREYPNNNWWYEVFSVKAWPQVFDGNTALKYARSRHSTSDFDRSERQQLILKWIKEKALSIGFLTSPEKIKWLFDAITSHIDTSLTLGEISELALWVKDIATDHINIYNLSNDCMQNKCSAWAYLYTPSREYFGWASVVLPENASATKLSSYEDIRRFSGFIFRYPEIRKEKYPITIIAGKWKFQQAKLLYSTFGKLGINFDDKKNLIEYTWSISTSHINVYWNKEAEVWINESSTIVRALQFLEEKIPYSFVVHNEYITTEWPRIEIIIWDDIRSYFTFAKPAYYLPYIPPQSHTGWDYIGTGKKTSISWEMQEKSPIQKNGNTQSSTPNKNNTIATEKKNESIKTTEFIVNPWEWEDF
jgi:LCP family protein required for cell wall assembly